MVKFESLNEKDLITISNKVFNDLQKIFSTYNLNIFKPMPSPIDRIQNKFRYRIIIKGIMNEEINEKINVYLKFLYDKNLKGTKISFELNPINMY